MVDQKRRELTDREILAIANGAYHGPGILSGYKLAQELRDRLSKALNREDRIKFRIRRIREDLIEIVDFLDKDFRY